MVDSHSETEARRGAGLSTPYGFRSSLDVMAGPQNDRTWRPDPRTVSWVLSVIDEAQVGRDFIEQLEQRIPGLATADPALIGEAAVECALIRAQMLTTEAQKVPPGTPIQPG